MFNGFAARPRCNGGKKLMSRSRANCSGACEASPQRALRGSSQQIGICPQVQIRLVRLHLLGSMQLCLRRWPKGRYNTSKRPDMVIYFAALRAACSASPVST